MDKRFTVTVTAGAVVEDRGKILIVQQKNKPGRPGPKMVLSQPTGHVEQGETIEEAVVREVKEETGYTVRPTSLIGVYLKQWPDKTSIRFSFHCELTDEEQAPIKDGEIDEVLWLPIKEVKARRDEYRPGSSAPTFDDYFDGKQYPLDLVKHFDWSKIDE